MKTVGIALGEGGARGIAHIAFLEVFERLNIRPSCMSGSSMGALISAFYALGYSTTDMISILEDANLFDFNNMLDFGFKKGGFIKGSGVMDFLGDYFKDKKIEDLDIPLKIVATDYWTCKPVVFDKGDLLSAVRASISIPGVFKPFEYDGRVLIDGGCISPVPFDLLRDDCDFLVAVDVSVKKTESASKVIPRIYEVMFNTYYIMMSAIVENMRKNTSLDLYLNPELSRVGIMDFLKFRRIIDEARKTAQVLEEKLKNLS